MDSNPPAAPAPPAGGPDASPDAGPDIAPDLAPGAALKAPRRYIDLRPGDRFPAFNQRSGQKPDFAFDSLAGRYALYSFFLSGEEAQGDAALGAVEANADLFDAVNWIFVGVSAEARDVGRPRLCNRDALFFINDLDFRVSRLCGAMPLDATEGAAQPTRRFWMVVDPTFHVLKVFPFDQGREHAALFAYMRSLPPPHLYGGRELPAPIIVIPNVLEPELCEQLVAYYHSREAGESGVMRDGKGVIQFSFKRRQDVPIDPPELRASLRQRIARRVVPEIERLFFMKIDVIERYIVGRYAAEDGGRFGPHRDNSPGVTAHRRYALSINLNDDFEGGEVTFPEYSMRGYKAQRGWAIIFPCAILHQVNPVTKGARYAFLPFLFDEGGRRIQAAYAQAQS